MTLHWCFDVLDYLLGTGFHLDREETFKTYSFDPPNPIGETIDFDVLNLVSTLLVHMTDGTPLSVWRHTHYFDGVSMSALSVPLRDIEDTGTYVDKFPGRYRDKKGIEKYIGE